MRKTSLLLQDRPDGVRSSSPTKNDMHVRLARHANVRIDPLFTMSDNTRLPPAKADGGRECSRTSRRTPAGGARRDRTDDLLLAKQALSQLSYGPAGNQSSDVSNQSL